MRLADTLMVMGVAGDDYRSGVWGPAHRELAMDSIQSAVPRTAWFRRSSNNQYLDAGSDGYLEALTRDDLRRCENLLNRALAAATR